MDIEVAALQAVKAAPTQMADMKLRNKQAELTKTGKQTPIEFPLMTSLASRSETNN